MTHGAALPGPFWERIDNWRVLRWAFVAVGAVVILALGHELHRHLQAIEAWVRSLGAWGPLAFVAIYVACTILLVPDSVFGVAAGLLFGLPLGTLVILAGTVLGALVEFPLAHHLFRAPVERFVTHRPALAAIRRAVARGDARLQAMIRLTPINRAVLSYVLASSGVRLGGYLAACLAHLPSIALEVWAGHAGHHLIELRGIGHARLEHELIVFGGLLVAVGGMFVVSRAARRAVERAAAT